MRSPASHPQAGSHLRSGGSPRAAERLVGCGARSAGPPEEDEEEGQGGAGRGLRAAPMHLGLDDSRWEPWAQYRCPAEEGGRFDFSSSFSTCTSVGGIGSTLTGPMAGAQMTAVPTIAAPLEPRMLQVRPVVLTGRTRSKTSPTICKLCHAAHVDAGPSAPLPACRPLEQRLGGRGQRQRAA